MMSNSENKRKPLLNYHPRPTTSNGIPINKEVSMKQPIRPLILIPKSNLSRTNAEMIKKRPSMLKGKVKNTYSEVSNNTGINSRQNDSLKPTYMNKKIESHHKGLNPIKNTENCDYDQRKSYEHLKTHTNKQSFKKSARPTNRPSRNRLDKNKQPNICQLRKHLTLLLHTKSSSDIENIKLMFREFKSDDENCLYLLDIIKTVNEICSSTVSYKKDILESLCCERFLKGLQIFILEKLKECTKTDDDKKLFECFFQNIFQLSRAAIELLSSTDLLRLKHMLFFIKSVLGRIVGRLYISQDLFIVKEMSLLIDEKVKMEELKREEVSLKEIDDMETMSILPTTSDLFGKAPVLKKNIVDGSYKSAGHYLTVQFNLLREDFVAPLREGIKEYLSNLNHRFMRNKSGISVYYNVEILRASISSGKLGHDIKLDRKTNWAVVSQFFIFGSLLLFTTNDFKTFFSGTVIEVNNKNQTIIVKLDGLHNEVCENIYAQEFVMAASKAFFEPYFHVLSALQKMKEEQFPMEKYIIHVDQNPEPPAYINRLGLSAYNIHEKDVTHPNVSILDPAWGNFKSVYLNPSQCRAFKAALTNEFVAIQGPPGTGKTFLALQIVTTLLANVRLDTPILVVCLKNHALDQFLESIIEFTKNVVRIGGRSKNEKLKNYNLKMKRTTYGYEHYATVLNHLAREYFKRENHVYGLNKHGIVSIDNILEYIPSPEFKAELMESDYIEWLMEGVYVDEETDILDLSNEVDCDIKLNDENNVDAENEADDLVEQFESLVDINDGSAEEGENTTPDMDPMDIMYDQVQENKKRVEETYTEEYSNIYDNNIEDVNEDEFLDEDIKGSGMRFSDKLTPKYSLTIHNLKYFCYMYECRIQELLEQQYEFEEDRQYMIHACHCNIEDTRARISFLKKMLSKNVKLNKKQLDKLYKISEISVWSLTTQQRWALYHSWVDCLAKDIKKEMCQIEEAIRREERSLDESRNENDLQILQRAKVVGITTTGAAKLRPMLNKLGAKIVVIEEAAEVLESHIVTALSNKCEHVIMIGDHKQLRPNPAVYQLCRKFNFDISLFERMVKNGLHCYTLGVQHRMRPEFASLIVPAMYPDLINHSSVEERPDILGVCSNLYFVNHNHPEEMKRDSVSHINKFEAEFVVDFVQYLLKQGYKKEEITILATYSGQVRYILKLKNGVLPPDLRVSTVDDFQGEENKIIVLSLVRSNEDRKIGFLKTENRVCVALSRARDGLFIIGDMDMLSENSQIWPKVKERLLEHNALGDSLRVHCQIHPKTVTDVSRGALLKQIPEGGCQLMCQIKLACGHACKFRCHPRDQDHKEKYRCSTKCEREICKRKLENHPCPKICGDDCSPCVRPVKFPLECGHKTEAPCSSDVQKLKCTEVVPCVRPGCGHNTTRLCHQTVEEAIRKRVCDGVCEKVQACNHVCMKKCHWPRHCTTVCQVKVKVTLPCGHEITKKCFHIFPDSKKEFITCSEVRKKTLPCGHTVAVHCYEHNRFSQCPVQVEKTLKCGHTLQVMCSESIGDVSCSEQIVRTLSCGHEKTAPCATPTTNLVCKKKCAKVLPCGHPCTQTCSSKCDCAIFVEKELPCGHEVSYKCGGTDQSVKCDKPCKRVMSCGHPCKASCSQPCSVTNCTMLVQSSAALACGHGPVISPCRLNHIEGSATELSKYCKVACEVQLQCGHTCPGNCSSCKETHQKCNAACSKTLPCSHKCSQLCVDECGPCYERCLNRCSHRKCEGVCGQPCPPCQEPCAWQCQHYRCSRPCFSFCNRKPCSAPCEKQLECGHPCIGYCGEVCPKECVQCDPEIAAALGGDLTSRFVVLEDCGHTVGIRLMDGIFNNSNNTYLVRCPVTTCQQPVVTTKRYRNLVRKIFINLMKQKRNIEENAMGDQLKEEFLNQNNEREKRQHAQSSSQRSNDIAQYRKKAEFSKPNHNKQNERGRRDPYHFNQNQSFETRFKKLRDEAPHYSRHQNSGGRNSYFLPQYRFNNMRHAGSNLPHRPDWMNLGPREGFPYHNGNQRGNYNYSMYPFVNPQIHSGIAGSELQGELHNYQRRGRGPRDNQQKRPGPRGQRRKV